MCQLSPDGRWLAGATSFGGGAQIYVESVTGTPGRWQISVQGGIYPRWTKGGRELLFEAIDGHVMAVDIDTATGFHAGTPRALFMLPSRSFSGTLRSWGCDEQGERFFVIEPVRVGALGTVEVVSGFQALVSRK